MKKSATETTIQTIGLDIAKNSFSLHRYDAGGIKVPAKDLKCSQMNYSDTSLYWKKVGASL